MVPLDNPTIASIVPNATTTVTMSSTPGMASCSPTNNSSCYASPLPIAPALPTCTYPMVTRAQNNIFCLKQLSVTTKHTLAPPFEPTYVSQALKDPKWRNMADEFTTLVSHGTRSLVPRPSGCLGLNIMQMAQWIGLRHVLWLRDSINAQVSIILRPSVQSSNQPPFTSSSH
jgi:hypothetical protein